MEQVGEACLQDLVDRGLVQIDKRSFGGKIKYCRIHDVLHSFCLREAQRENLLYVINENNLQVARVERSRVHNLGTRLAKSLDPKGWIQNLFVSKDWMTGSNRKACRWICSQLPLECPFPQAIYKTSIISKEVGSFLYFPNSTGWPDYSWNQIQLFCYLKLLRVLDIRKLPFMDGIPSEILNLVNLRYLAVVATYEALQEYQWFKFPNLQTIIVEAIYTWRVVKSPLDILDDMRPRRLRHVQSPNWSFNIPNLVQENLETISWLNLPQRLITKPDFKKIPNVKKLGIYIDINTALLEPPGLELVPHSSVDGLVDLWQLENLKIDAPEPIDFRFAFQLLTAFPPNVKKLTIHRTSLPWENMAIIGTLPNLEALKLKEDAFCGPEWKTRENENGFLKLKYLKIVLLDLKYLSAHLPVLECLIVDCCGVLKKFPSSFVDITTLQLIELTRCCSSLVTSAKLIQEEISECFGDDKLVVRDYDTSFQR